jgi:hypothetical protein
MYHRVKCELDYIKIFQLISNLSQDNAVTYIHPFFKDLRQSPQLLKVIFKVFEPTLRKNSAHRIERVL